MKYPLAILGPVVRTPWLLVLFVYLLGALSLPGYAIDLEDGTTMLGLAAGIGNPEGASSKALGQAAILGGQVFYDKMGEWGIGLQIDHFNFKSKSAGHASMSSALLAGRANIPTSSDLYLPYFLGGIGYADGSGYLPGGGYTHGSGLGLRLGGGVERFLTENVSAGIEFRLDRLSAALGGMGISGATVAAVVLRLDFWLDARPNPFANR